MSLTAVSASLSAGMKTMPESKLIFFAAVYSLWKREILRFVRDRNRLLGSILQPPPEIEVGDPDFQREFIINGTNSEKVVSMLANQEGARRIWSISIPVR